RARLETVPGMGTPAGIRLRSGFGHVWLPGDALNRGREDCTRERTRYSRAAPVLVRKKTGSVGAISARGEACPKSGQAMRPTCDVRASRVVPECPPRRPKPRRAYFGGVVLSGGGGVVDPFGVVLGGGVVWSDGGVVVVAP